MKQPMGRSVQVTGDVSGQLAVGEHITQITYQQIQPRQVDPETLAAAEAGLAALPLEGVPWPGALPRPCARARARSFALNSTSV